MSRTYRDDVSTVRRSKRPTCRPGDRGLTQSRCGSRRHPRSQAVPMAHAVRPAMASQHRNGLHDPTVERVLERCHLRAHEKSRSARPRILEGDVNCACSLYAGLQGHGDKRNGAEIGSLDPGPLDVEQVMHAVATYGDPAKAAKAAVIGSGPGSRAKSSVGSQPDSPSWVWAHHEQRRDRSGMPGVPPCRQPRFRPGQNPGRSSTPKAAQADVPRGTTLTRGAAWPGHRRAWESDHPSVGSTGAPRSGPRRA